MAYNCCCGSAHFVPNKPNYYVYILTLQHVIIVIPQCVICCLVHKPTVADAFVGGKMFKKSNWVHPHPRYQMHAYLDVYTAIQVHGQ